MALLMKAVLFLILAIPPAVSRRVRKDAKERILQKDNFHTLVDLDKEMDQKTNMLDDERGALLETVVASDSSAIHKAPVDKQHRYTSERKAIDKKKHKKEKRHKKEKKQKKDKLKGERATLLRRICHVDAVRGPEWRSWDVAAGGRSGEEPEWERLQVCTLTFTSPFGLEPTGPHDVRMDLGDVLKVVVPHHKAKSYSMSAKRLGEFDITFKLYPNGRASGYLDSLEVGDDIYVYSKGSKRREAGSHVGLIAFGIGITEALPIAAAELAKPEAQHVRLLWALRTYGDFFWHQEIAALQAAYPERFSVVTILSRQRDGPLHGRVNPELLSRVFDGAWHTAIGDTNEGKHDGVRFLCVGTKPMMKAAWRMLNQIGYRKPLLTNR